MLKSDQFAAMGDVEMPSISGRTRGQALEDRLADTVDVAQAEALGDLGAECVV